MPKTKERVTDAADTMKPYVDRAMHDDELRENLKTAFAAARDVYSDLVGGRGVTTVATRVATDKDIQENLKTAVEELRTAARRIQGKEDHTTRNTMLLLAGITIGILFNPMTGPGTRKWLMDKVTGGGDDFTYGGGGTTGGGTGSAGNSPVNP